MTGETFANVKLTPIGPSYVTTENGAFDATKQSDLTIQVFATSPSLSVVAGKDRTGIGGAEQIGALHLLGAGDYAIRVRGKQDVNQFYQLDLAFTTEPTPGLSADLNLDNVANAADWSLFVESAGLAFPGLTQREEFMRGDLNYDGKSDYADFKLFKSAYVLANGAAAFAALHQVPEPSSALALLTGLGCAAAVRRRRSTTR